MADWKSKLYTMTKSGIRKIDTNIGGAAVGTLIGVIFISIQSRMFNGVSRRRV
jgi:hypothetical protein